MIIKDTDILVDGFLLKIKKRIIFCHEKGTVCFITDFRKDKIQRLIRQSKF